MRLPFYFTIPACCRLVTAVLTRRYRLPLPVTTRFAFTFPFRRCRLRLHTRFVVIYGLPLVADGDVVPVTRLVTFTLRLVAPLFICPLFTFGIADQPVIAPLIYAATFTVPTHTRAPRLYDYGYTAVTHGYVVQLFPLIYVAVPHRYGCILPGLCLYPVGTFVLLRLLPRVGCYLGGYRCHGSSGWTNVYALPHSLFCLRSPRYTGYVVTLRPRLLICHIYYVACYGWTLFPFVVWVVGWLDTRLLHTRLYILTTRSRLVPIPPYFRVTGHCVVVTVDSPVGTRFVCWLRGYRLCLDVYLLLCGYHNISDGPEPVRYYHDGCLTIPRPDFTFGGCYGWLLHAVDSAPLQFTHLPVPGFGLPAACDLDYHVTFALVTFTGCYNLIVRLRIRIVGDSRLRCPVTVRLHTTGRSVTVTVAIPSTVADCYVCVLHLFVVCPRCPHCRYSRLIWTLPHVIYHIWLRLLDVTFTGYVVTAPACQPCPVGGYITTIYVVALRCWWWYICGPVGERYGWLIVICWIAASPPYAYGRYTLRLALTPVIPLRFVIVLYLPRLFIDGTVFPTVVTLHVVAGVTVVIG